MPSSYCPPELPKKLGTSWTDRPVALVAAVEVTTDIRSSALLRPGSAMPASSWARVGSPLELGY